jgi:transposase
MTQKVVEFMKQNPHSSLRRLANLEGMPSYATIHRIVKDAKFHPYVLQIHQCLQEQDKKKRVMHAQSQLALMLRNPEFLTNLLFSDEAHFNLHGTVNTQNCRYWSQTNPGWCQEKPLHSPRVTVWAAIGWQGVVGPVFFEETINGANYLHMLQQTLLPTIQHWPHFASLVFMQDGAPPHWSVAVRNFLTENLPNRWMGRGSPNLPWPPYSPDLTPCDFFLWGWLKSRVYANPLADVGELCGRIHQAFADLPQAMINRAVQAYKKRLTQCIAVKGGSVEEVKLLLED